MNSSTGEDLDVMHSALVGQERVARIELQGLGEQEVMGTQEDTDVAEVDRNDQRPIFHAVEVEVAVAIAQGEEQGEEMHQRGTERGTGQRVEVHVTSWPVWEAAKEGHMHSWSLGDTLMPMVMEEEHPQLSGVLTNQRWVFWGDAEM